MAVLAVLLAVAGCTQTPPAPQRLTNAPEPPAEPKTNSVVIGVDSVSGGFNPHVLADMSPTTTALAQTMLPSVFRPDDQGKLRLDTTVMRSAKVVKSDPFTVSYQIRQDASWSDGAPIAAESFSYLADQMRTQPGTVDSAGYRLISDVSSRDGGKRVVVRFKSYYPAWKTLFSNLLPAQVLKDVPGGWQSAMSDDYPASGGPLAIKGIDADRGEITMERNERYWAKPAAVDQLILRRSDSGEVASGLRDGDTQFALTRTDASEQASLQALGKGFTVTTAPRGEVASVLLRPTSDVLEDSSVRSAVSSLIDRSRLVEVGAMGGPSQRLVADSQVSAPSDPAYAKSIPAADARPDPRRAQSLLQDAGYVKTAGHWADAGGRRLKLVVAAPGDKQPYRAIATELVAQLKAAGVDASVLLVDARDLFGNDPTQQSTTEPTTSQPPPTTTPNDEPGTSPDVPSSEVDGADVVVGPQPVGADGASTLASRLSCPTDSSESTGADDAAPGNTAGFCDRTLDATVRQVMTGRQRWSSVASQIDRHLWDEHVSIPLFQVADTLTVSSGVAGVAADGLSGPFDSAVNWVRTK